MSARAAGLVVCAALAACTRSNMDSQPKYHEYEPGGLFRDGQVLQAPVPGTVAQGDLAREAEARERPPLTPALLARGEEQYDVFCSPCHDRTGAGQGMIVQRGLRPPPSLHDQRLRAASDADLFDVISNGRGAMYAYADVLRPRDRWAVVAYLRALQLSRHASLDDLTPDERRALAAEAAP